MSNPPVPGAPQDPAYSSDASQQVGPVPPQAWAVHPAAHEMRPEHFPTAVGRDGRIAWSLGLLGLLGIPGLSILAPSLAMLITGLLQRRKNPVARSVGTRAAIFGGISLLATILFFTFVFGILLPLIDAGVVADDAVWPVFIVAPLGVWVVIAGPITAIVMGIVGLAKPVSREKAQQLYARAGR